MNTPGQSLQLGIETLIAIDEDALNTLEAIAWMCSNNTDKIDPELQLSLGAILSDHLAKRQQLVTDAKRSQRLA